MTLWTPIRGLLSSTLPTFISKHVWLFLRASLLLRACQPKLAHRYHKTSIRKPTKHQASSVQGLPVLSGVDLVLTKLADLQYLR